MADLPKLDRPQRRISQPSELDGITMLGRTLGQAGSRYNPDGMTVRAPLIDARGFIDEARGMASVGRSVAEIGQATQQLASQEAKAIAERQLLDVQDGLDALEVELATSLGQEPDENKWRDILTDHTGKASALLQQEGIMADAKLAGEQAIKRWIRRQEFHTTQAKTRRSFSRVAESLSGRVETLLDRENFADAAALVGSEQARLYLGEDWQARSAVRINQARENSVKLATAEAEKAEWNAVSSAAIADPIGWKREHPTAWEGKEQLWARARNVADEAQRQGEADALTDLANAIATGEMTVPGQVDAATSPFLSPQLKEQAKGWLLQRDSRAEALDKEKNGVRNAVELRRKVADYDAAGDPDRSKGFALMAEIKSRVPGEWDGTLTGDLYERMNATAPNLKVRPEIQSLVSKSLAASFDEVRRAKSTKAPDGKMVLSSEDNQRFLLAETKVEMHMADWFKANPQAKPEEAIAEMGKALPAGTRLIGLQAIKRAQAQRPPTATDSPVRQFIEAPDLKETLPDPLKPHAQDFIDAGRETGLNPRVLAAISIFETGRGTSKAFREKRNAMGISNSSGPIEQTSVRDSIFYMARRLAATDGPYTKANTLDEIGGIYAPVGAENDPRGTNGGWADGVKTHLRNLTKAAKANDQIPPFSE